MTESEFLALAESTLNEIEQAFDRLFEQDIVDVECKRSGNVLEIEFVDNGSKIIVNSQAPLQEMWIAARAGGFHYKRVGDEWRNTRNDTEFFTSLADFATEQGGAPVKLK
jgi:CyaY protein